MPRGITAFALVALIASVAATMAALAGSDISSSTRALSTETEARRPDAARADTAVAAARRYALVARNWTLATYQASWDRRVDLAGGPYRRALIAQRPDRRELITLRRDRGRSKARVLGTERDPGMQPPVARVLVTLDETTNLAGQTIRGATLNQVRLRRRGGRWLVFDWTVIPDAGA